MVLFVNTCVRPESRTYWLAKQVLKRIKGEIKEIFPHNEPLTNNALMRRTQLAEKGDFDDPIFEDAKLFSSADQIVIAAPYWDLSFPALLKNYIEAVNIVGLTFAYREDGKPYGLCSARRLIYVTTAGGTILNDTYGYGYIRELSSSFYGIPEIICVKAECLDIIGSNVEAILQETVQKMGYFE